MDTPLTHYKLISALAIKEFKIRYKNARLGFLWAFVYPIILMAVLNLVFTKILTIKISNYPFFLLCGLFPWTFFATSLSNSTVSIVDNARLIQKIYFPRAIIPIAVIFNNLINFIFCITLLIALILIFKIKLSFYIIYLPLILAIQLILIVSISLTTSHLYIQYRDIRYLVDVLLLIWFYATPIFYPVELVPQEIYPFYIYNPMVGIISGYRNIILEAKPPDFGLLCISFLETIILFIVGYRVAKRYGPTAADYV